MHSNSMANSEGFMMSGAWVVSEESSGVSSLLDTVGLAGVLGKDAPRKSIVWLIENRESGFNVSIPFRDLTFDDAYLDGNILKGESDRGSFELTFDGLTVSGNLTIIRKYEEEGTNRRVETKKTRTLAFRVSGRKSPVTEVLMERVLELENNIEQQTTGNNEETIDLVIKLKLLEVELQDARDTIKNKDAELKTLKKVILGLNKTISKLEKRIEEGGQVGSEPIDGDGNKKAASKDNFQQSAICKSIQDRLEKYEKSLAESENNITRDKRDVLQTVFENKCRAE